MKRLYKIIILFIVIFLVGIFMTVKTINNTFSSEENKVETVSLSSNILKLSIKI